MSQRRYNGNVHANTVGPDTTEEIWAKGTLRRCVLREAFLLFKGRHYFDRFRRQRQCILFPSFDFTNVNV